MADKKDSTALHADHDTALTDLQFNANNFGAGSLSVHVFTSYRLFVQLGATRSHDAFDGYSANAQKLSIVCKRLREAPSTGRPSQCLCSLEGTPWLRTSAIWDACGTSSLLSNRIVTLLASSYRRAICVCFRGSKPAFDTHHCKHAIANTPLQTQRCCALLRLTEILMTLQVEQSS